MKQLYLFSSDTFSSDLLFRSSQESNHWKLYIDGASRNNPGPAGAGVYILKNNKLAEKGGFYLGKKTNNQAEYLALLLGIFYLRERVEKNDTVLVVSDSELLVKQLQGKYKVRSVKLKPLYNLAKVLLATLNYDIAHVLRADNEQADELANTGIDKKRKIPDKFITLLRTYGISL